MFVNIVKALLAKNMLQKYHIIFADLTMSVALWYTLVNYSINIHSVDSKFVSCYSIVSAATQETASDADTLVNGAEGEEESEGRLPTPQIRGSGSPYVRHHLDRTTPSVGGALLTSPPRVKDMGYKG